MSAADRKRPSGTPLSSAAMPKMIFPMRDQRRVSNTDQPSGLYSVGLNPLAWIESISAAAEKQDAINNHGRAAAPIRVNGTGLSFQHPALLKKKTHQSSENYILKEEGKLKRARVVGDETGRPDDDIGPWDLSELMQDPLQPAFSSVLAIQELAMKIEATEYMDASSKASYRRIRAHFELKRQSIVALETTNGEEGDTRTAALCGLYQNTIHKLEVLVQTIDTETMKKVSAQPAQALDEEAPATSSVDKKDFANYMTQWLRDNWTNPYPDDEGLAKMASDCDTTTTIVGNWLINARTRKWRPAIVKAFKEQRPAETLMEDSINLFDGKPLRELDGSSPDDVEYPSAKRMRRS